MRFARVAVVAVAVFVIASSCNETVKTVTASYGSDIVAGEVLMSDGRSPAGVEVSVVGTGMRTVVAGDGRFAFQGVREKVTLRFRRSDGIDRLETTSAGSAITVTIPSPVGVQERRSEPSTFEGSLAALSGDTLVITTEDGDIATVMTANTQIRRSGVTLGIGDLGAGDQVRLRTTIREGALTVLELDVMGDRGPYVLAPSSRTKA